MGVWRVIFDGWVGSRYHICEASVFFLGGGGRKILREVFYPRFFLHSVLKIFEVYHRCSLIRYILF